MYINESTADSMSDEIRDNKMRIMHVTIVQIKVD